MATRNLDNETGQAIRRLIDKGESVEQIMKTLNVARSTVYTYSKGHSFANRDSHDDVQELRRSGASIFDIRERTGKDARTISRICRKIGLGVTDVERTESHKRNSELNAHDEEWAVSYIREKSELRLEYYSGYVNMDSPVMVKCTHCGAISKKGMQCFRTGRALCGICHYDPEKEQRRAEAAERKMREKEVNRILKETQMLVKAGRGEQLSFNFCSCGELINLKKRYCDHCRKRAENKRREISRRRKVQNAIVDKDITLERLYSRDKGVCYLCGQICDWNDKEVREDCIVCGNQYPSIDHAIPLSKGGLHSWDNVKLAHRICNSLKADNYDEENLEKPNSESNESCWNLPRVV